jgi:CRP/FNR family cyclic AMP-dependent transcriptional regulator
MSKEMQRSGEVPTTSSNPDVSWLGDCRRRGFLGRLPDRLVALVLKGAQRVEYPPGTVGLRWDQAPKAAIVLSGTLRSYISYPDGGQVTTRYLKAGDMTGAYAPRKPLLARGVQALESSELLFIDPVRLKDLSLAESQIGWALVEELTTVVAQYQRALCIRAFGSVRQRVVMALVDNASAAGQLAAGRRVPGTQQELATAVGSVREVVAATLGALKHEGLIDVRRGAVVILDPDRLAREAESVVGAGA